MDTDAPARLTSKPSWLITQLAMHAGRLAFQGFAQAGARGYHYRLLATLQEFGPASQANLGRRCGVDRKDVAVATNQLAEQGFVERAPDPTDRRRNIVSITGDGKRQLRRLDRALDSVQAELLAPLSAGERETLTTLLNRLLTYHSSAAG